MHEMGVFWLRMATALYGVGLLHVMAVLLRRKAGFLKHALFAFLIAARSALCRHCRAATAARAPACDNFFESRHGLRVPDRRSVSIRLLALRFRQPQRLHFSAGLRAYASGRDGDAHALAGPAPSAQRWLLVHVMMILLGYAALLLTAVASIFYLIQERQLKTKKAGRSAEYFAHFSSACRRSRTLDNLITNAMSFGFVFITLGVIAGSTWAFIESGHGLDSAIRASRSRSSPGASISTMVFLRAPRDGEAAKPR